MESNRTLPIHQIAPDILHWLTKGSRLVIVAPTGSGKTTQVPQIILDAGLAGENGSWSCSRGASPREPLRRVSPTSAAVELAMKSAFKFGLRDATGAGTRISYVTEGILLRRLQEDPQLSSIGVLIFDEFHERNLLSDVGLALAKRLHYTTRPDLKLLVMSATLEAEPVADYLSKGPDGAIHTATPILQSEGQMYPVEVRYLAIPDERAAADQAADAVEDILRQNSPGDILVFMPGMGEINSTIGALHSLRTQEKLALIPLHGDLPPEQQDLAFQPNPFRKIIVATNVAETSVTIDGVRHVVDSGLARVSRYDAERGITTLLLERISRASSEQRKGRAGRTAPGTCHRLWTESGQLDRPEKNTPEIQRSDLAEVVLLLHSLGVQRAVEFDWLDKPEPAAVERAERLCHTLGALRSPEAGSGLTDIGRQMLRLPMHPRYSRMIVEAARFNCVPAAALCAALVSGRDLLMRLGREEKHIKEARELFEASADSDFHTLTRAFQFAKNNGFSVERCRRYGIHAQTAREVERTWTQILDIAKRVFPGAPSAGEDIPERGKNADDPLLRCLTAGFIDQVCLRRDTGSLDCDLTEGRQGTLMRDSVVTAPLCVAATIREVAGRGMENVVLLGMATAVKVDWIKEMFAEQLTTTLEHLYDRTHKRVAAVKLLRFHDLVIGHEHQREVDTKASGSALAQAFVKGYFELPLLNHEVKQFIARVNLVAAVMPELELPAIDEAATVAALSEAFEGKTLAKEAQAVPLLEHFHNRVAREQLAWIDELAPKVVAWHDGRKLKLNYPAEVRDEDGEPNSPELQVKLQECFGLREHPHICEGRLPVKLWLCSPDGKRIESTFNWSAFKANTYPKLKVTLQKKYPGTPWI